MKRTKRKELVIIMAPKVILQKNHNNKQWNNKFKRFSQIITTCKTKIMIIVLPIFAICKDTWFVDSKISQNLTF